jgi:hypothetical protein
LQEQPQVKSIFQTAGMLLAALGLFVLRKTAEPPLPKSTSATSATEAV